jgi:hypothetical protein
LHLLKAYTSIHTGRREIHIANPELQMGESHCAFAAGKVPVAGADSLAGAYCFCVAGSGRETGAMNPARTGLKGNTVQRTGKPTGRQTWVRCFGSSHAPLRAPGLSMVPGQRTGLHFPYWPCPALLTRTSTLIPRAFPALYTRKPPAARTGLWRGETR